MYCTGICLNFGAAAKADPTNLDGSNDAAAAAAPDRRNERRLRPLLNIICSFSTGEDPLNSATEYYEIRDGEQTIDPAWRRRTGRGAAGIHRHASPAQPPGAHA